MKIIVFGATGGTGRLVVEEALKSAHTVTAFVRDARRMDVQHPGLTCIEGNLQNAQDVEAAVQDHHAVVCTLGAPLMTNTRVRTWGTQAIVDAMLKTHVNRLVCSSSFGAGDSFKHLPPLYRYAIAPLLLRRVLADHNGQEDIARRSRLQWTFVRPVNLTDGPETGRFVTGVGQPDQKLSMKISRRDVAAFIVQQLGDAKYLQKSPYIAHIAKSVDQTLCAPRNVRA